jgi:hypothetical protein
MLTAPAHLQEADDGVCSLQLLLPLCFISLQLADARCELVNAALTAATASEAAAKVAAGLSIVALHAMQHQVEHTAANTAPQGKTRCSQQYYLCIKCVHAPEQHRCPDLLQAPHLFDNAYTPTYCCDPG